MAAKDHVAVRLDPATLERLDVLREVLSTEWHEASQSDVLRAVIFGGLKSLEKEHATRVAEIRKRREGDKPAASEKPAAPKRGKRTKS
jgi:hypothetical protein